MSQNRSNDESGRGAWRSPVMLDDLTADLIWPRLLKAGPLALRPSRMGLAFFYLVGLALLASLADLVDGLSDQSALALAWSQWVEHLHGLFTSIAAADGPGVGQAVNGLFISVIWTLVHEYPLIGIVFVPLIILWTTFMGGAISRIAAMDFAQGVGLSWPQGVGFAASRWASFAGSVFGPLGLAYAAALVLAVGGWALFNITGLNAVGGLLWFLFLIAAAVITVITLAMTLGGPMLVPAVACEGTDAIDAIQHAYSYVFAKPLRLIIYMLILGLQFVALFVLVTAAIWMIVHISQHGAGIWVGDEADRVIRGERALSGVAGFASGAVRFWTGIPLLLGGAFAVSYFWCAATVLYLAMRRICDGQDISEVWVETIVPGTMAERKGPAAPAGGAIADNGPADET